MTTPNSNPKKRGRDEEDHPAHGAEKKGKAVSPLIPALPDAPGLTRWQPARVARPLNSMQASPLEIAMVRQACMSYLKQQVRSPELQFTQANLSWKVGTGKCAPFCMEYIHWRRAQKPPEKVIRYLKKPEVQARTEQVDELVVARYEASNKAITLAAEWPARDRIYSSALAHTAEQLPNYTQSVPFETLGQILMAKRRYPEGVEPRTWRRLVGQTSVDFSLEALAAMCPPALPTIAVLSVYLFAPESPVLPPASSSSTSSSSSSAQPPREFKHGGNSGAPTSRGNPLIEADLAAHQANAVFHRLFSPVQNDPFFIVSMAGNTHAHVVVMDLTKSCGGIFDPNVGLIRFSSNPTREEVIWLLSVMLAAYDFHTVSLFGF